MTRDEIWTAAIAFADAHMRKGGRKSWDDTDWSAMVAEFDRLCPPMELVPTSIIRAEVNRRVARETPKGKSLLPCAWCGTPLGTRERRGRCTTCKRTQPGRRRKEG